MLKLGILSPICATLGTHGYGWTKGSSQQDGQRFQIAADYTGPDGLLIGPENIGSLLAMNMPVLISVGRVTVVVGRSRGSKCYS
jgi:hypothetical protein